MTNPIDIQIEQLCKQHDHTWKSICSTIDELVDADVLKKQAAYDLKGSIARMGKLKKRIIRQKMIKVLQENTFSGDNYKL